MRHNKNMPLTLLLLFFFSTSAMNLAAVSEQDTKQQSCNEQFDMVIISPELFVSELQPLIDHKNNHGLKTTLKTVEDIYEQYSGFDNAEQIKYFIKNAIEAWDITFVFIIGDVDKVPIRKIQIYGWDGDYKIITDHYYADIYDHNNSFSDWDPNNNNIYGEFSQKDGIIDYMDLYPDINIGRLPCETKEEVNILVKKIIEYETSTYEADWFHNIILMGGDITKDNGIIEGEVETRYIGNAMENAGFSLVTLWTSTCTFRPLLINYYLSKGAGFVAYAGHGAESGLATYTPNGKLIRYKTEYLLGLFNQNKLPIIYLFACNTANLGYSKEIVGIKIPCFASALVKKPSGGAIACIGCTTEAFGEITDGGPQNCGYLLALAFFEAYEPGITVSEMLLKAKTSTLDNMWSKHMYEPLTTCGHILLGDPSLKTGGYR